MSQLAQLHLDEASGITVATVDGEIDLSNATELEMAISHAVGNEAVGLASISHGWTTWTARA